MHIEVRGDGPPLVMIHGWAMHCGLFGALLDRLSTRRTLYLVDLPGHGRSRDDASLLDLESCVAAIAAATPPAPWLGWSLGGLFALHAAETRPEHVTALAMLCSTPRFVRATDWPQGMDVEVFRNFETGLQTDVHATVERFLALETLGCAHAKDSLRALRAQAFAHGDPAPSALADGLHLLENTDLRDLLPGLRVRSLWIGARRDRLVDPRAVAAAAALAPGSRHVQLDSGHAPFLTHADDLAAAIIEFFESAFSVSGQNLPLTPLPQGEGRNSQSIDIAADPLSSPTQGGAGVVRRMATIKRSPTPLSSPSPNGRGVGVRGDEADTPPHMDAPPCAETPDASAAPACDQSP